MPNRNAKKYSDQALRHSYFNASNILRFGRTDKRLHSNERQAGLNDKNIVQQTHGYPLKLRCFFLCIFFTWNHSLIECFHPDIHITITEAGRSNERWVKATKKGKNLMQPLNQIIVIDCFIFKWVVKFWSSSDRSIQWFWASANHTLLGECYVVSTITDRQLNFTFTCNTLALLLKLSENLLTESPALAYHHAKAERESIWFNMNYKIIALKVARVRERERKKRVANKVKAIVLICCICVSECFDQSVLHT